ncbi:MAG: lytic transglycosylase domain-containing protein [Rickettsiales bacterium]|nr:lytic transglycosylase domain-containing protein [Rickettsiales bacterium]
MIFSRISPWLVLLMMGMAASAHAASEHAAPEVSRLCSQNFARVERELGIPKQLTQAISMTESGRWSDEAKAVVPWPWTINAQGQGYYFDTMHDAVTFARRLQLKGVQSMDVGCMQVNLKHHPDAFSSLMDAFNPTSNVAYGAKFLRSNFDDLGNWREAIAAYHSRGTAKGRAYYTNVRKNWQRALGGPVQYASASDVLFNGRTRDYGGLSPRNRMFSISVRDGESSHSLGDAKTRSEDRMTSRMKVIQVGDRRRASGSPEVLVVRPASAKSEAPAYDSEESPVLQTASRGGSAPETILAESTHASPKVARVSSSQKGPNFIFD